MDEKRPLSRRQLRNIQLARGIPALEFQHRTGMPRASYEALLGASSGEEGKDAAKLISRQTFDRVVSLLGIDEEFTSLRRKGVIEWRAEGTSKVTAASWREAVESLVSELFSDDLLLVEVRTEGAKRFGRGSERMVLLHDRVNEFRIAIMNAADDLVGLLEKAFGTTCERRVTISAPEFHDAREMISHEVFRSVQFDAISGAIAPKYSWRDVQAGAREFGFLPDDLIEMMHQRAQERAQRGSVGPASGGEEEYAVRRLQLVTTA
ncbi:hypothetical protein LA345_37150 (plasmid) [Burkholderia vietnamiensis]|uniref:Uncharacterized protein n=1 Tax=Burkholderia vietnamiensis (strain G4 / LMG 22486) TaxID=269482 RepID=A4JVF2_BURVG|nr:hypothetical protein Bcep1808_7378 [Burkholderia vietnamiensis G4]MCB4349443.1 hypothetical protein [Burkholderia vietnamiensis]